jgi:hypothetical protein
MFVIVYAGMGFNEVYISTASFFFCMDYMLRSRKGSQKRGLAISLTRQILQPLSALILDFRVSARCWQALLPAGYGLDLDLLLHFG